MARPTKLTERRLHRLQRAIATGLPFKIAAKGCGIDFTTLRNWIKRGEAELTDLDPAVEVDPDEDPEAFNQLPIHVRLVLLCERAEFDAAQSAMATVRRGLTPNSKSDAPAAWQSGAWLLERRYPAEFGQRRNPLEHRGEEDASEEYARRLHDYFSAFDAAIEPPPNPQRPVNAN
jgi:hypothetical protein